MSRDRDAGAVQTNAADPRQVQYGRRAERDAFDDTRRAYRDVLATDAGRRVVWDLLTRAGMYQSVMHADPSRVFYNAGRQDFGHELLAELTAHHPQAYLAMEAEARERQARQSRANVAIRTPATDDEAI